MLVCEPQLVSSHCLAFVVNCNRVCIKYFFVI